MQSEINAESLLEVREILELAAVKMAAERRTLDDLRKIKTAQDVYYDQVLNYGIAVEEGLMFHLEVVAASNNVVLKSLFLKIIPDLIVLSDSRKGEGTVKNFKAIEEHNNIIKHITNQNIEEAAEAMKLHLEN